MIPLWPVHESLLKNYEFHISNEKEPRTVKMYLTEIRQFLSWMETKEKTLIDLSQEDVISFRDEMVGRGRKISTINKRISIVSSFLGWSVEKGMLQENVAQHLRIVEMKKEQRDWLTVEQEEKLLKIVSEERNPLKRARNEALVYLMLYAGLRVEEISSLQYQSIEQGQMVIGQTAARKVPIVPVLQVKLLEWMKHRSLSEKKMHQESVFLFVTERSGYMQPRSIQFVIESFSGKMGFPISCKVLRHTFCRRLVERNEPLDLIMRLSGYLTIKSVIRYLDE